MKTLDTFIGGGRSVITLFYFTYCYVRNALVLKTWRAASIDGDLLALTNLLVEALESWCLQGTRLFPFFHSLRPPRRARICPRAFCHRNLTFCWGFWVSTCYFPGKWEGKGWKALFSQSFCSTLPPKPGIIYILLTRTVTYGPSLPPAGEEGKIVFSPLPCVAGHTETRRPGNCHLPSLCANCPQCKRTHAFRSLPSVWLLFPVVIEELRAHLFHICSRRYFVFRGTG